jgi:hypothetical protein
VLVNAEDVAFKTLLPELVTAGNVPPKKLFPLLVASGVLPKILLPVFVIPEHVPPKTPPAPLVGLPKPGSFVFASVVSSVVDGTVEAEVDGTDPNLEIGVAVKEGADAEIEKLLFPSKFAIVNAVVGALILPLATLLAKTLDEF